MSKYWANFDIREPDFEIEEENPFSVENTRIRQAHVLRMGLVTSLVITIVFVFAARHIQVTDRLELEVVEPNLVLIAMKTITPQKPPPPPPPKVLPPPVIVKQPDKVPDVITTKIKPVSVDDRLKRQRKKNITLKLEEETSPYANNNSSIGDLTGPDAKDRRRPAVNGVPNIKTKFRTDGENLTAGLDALDLNLKKPKSERKGLTDEAGLDLKLPQKKAHQKTKDQKVEEDISYLLDTDVSVVLTSADLSMGVEEYKIWNKINAEFDRWDKGRYGAMPKVLQRKGRAIIAFFQYKDGSAHRVVWLRGTTRLYVSGEKRENRLEELGLALNSIIHLNTRKGRI